MYKPKVPMKYGCKGIAISDAGKGATELAVLLSRNSSDLE